MRCSWGYLWAKYPTPKKCAEQRLTIKKNIGCDGAIQQNAEVGIFVFFTRADGSKT